MLDRVGAPVAVVKAAATQRFLVRNSDRWAVHSEPPRSFAAELPCQPQTQVIVCSRWR